MNIILKINSYYIIGMTIAYILGYTETTNNIINYESSTYRTPDEALYHLQEVIARVMKDQFNFDLKTKSVNEINFIKTDLPAIILDETFSMECIKNHLEDLQILVYKKVNVKGYIYNSISTKTIFNFFLKQVVMPDVIEFTPEIKTLIESFKQISFVEELNKNVKNKKLIKTIVPPRKKNFQSDFQKELSEKISKKR